MEEQQSQNQQCCAVVLAAGNSSRLGQPKQLVRYKNETLLVRTIRQAKEAGCSSVIVVLGFEANRMKNALTGWDVQIVMNTKWATGMASSLHAGLAAWSGPAPADSNVLLLLCDQPHVQTDDLRKLLAMHTSQHLDVTAAVYAGRMGVPAVFRRNLVEELMAITGDKGARDVIDRHREKAGTIDLPAAEFDVDSLDDLRHIENRRV